MAHTNSTAHYHLPQYVGTDIINPLTDTNKAYEDIDTALYEQGQSIADADGDIDALKIQNGDNALDTTAQTLSGAVNELKGGADALGLRVTASETNISTLQTQMTTATGNITTLNNTVTGLQTEVASKASATDLNNLTTKVGTGNLNTVAQNCVDAINEVYASANRGSVSVTADGTKTWSTLLNGLHSAIDETKIKPTSVFVYGSSVFNMVRYSSFYQFTDTIIDSNDKIYVSSMYIASTNSSFKAKEEGASVHDSSAEVVSSGLTLTIYY